jgi:hypothetical protein
VYGAIQDEHTATFLREMVNLSKENSYYVIIGGDFNLLRATQEEQM